MGMGSGSVRIPGVISKYADELSLVLNIGRIHVVKPTGVEMHDVRSLPGVAACEKSAGSGSM